jgi:hypothetical protein
MQLNVSWLRCQTATTEFHPNVAIIYLKVRPILVFLSNALDFALYISRPFTHTPIISSRIKTSYIICNFMFNQQHPKSQSFRT